MVSSFSRIYTLWRICADQEGGDLSVPEQHHANYGGADIWVATNGSGQPGGAALWQPSFLSFHRHEPQSLHGSFRYTLTTLSLWTEWTPVEFVLMG